MIALDLALDTDFGTCPECGTQSLVEHEHANVSYLSCRCGYKELVRLDDEASFDDEPFAVFCRKERDRYLCTPEQLVGASLFVPNDQGDQVCLRVTGYLPATGSFTLLGGLRFNAQKLVSDLDQGRVQAARLWRDLTRDETPDALYPEPS